MFGDNYLSPLTTIKNAHRETCETPRRGGGYDYHALNRGVARLPLFQKYGVFDAFERVLIEAMAKHPIRLLKGWDAGAANGTSSVLRP